MLSGIKRAVFFGAHTDDEMVCAGTLHRLVKQGTEVQVVAFSPAALKEDRTGALVEASNAVYQEFKASMRQIGVIRSWFLAFQPSSELHELGQEICQFAFDHVEREKPDLVLTLSPDDENPAHAEVGRQCERVMRGRVPWVVRCQFPWNYSIGRANLFVSLSEENLRVKEAVIDCYKSQHFRYRYGEMLMAQAKADGLSVKVEAAEKFELIRGVV